MGLARTAKLGLLRTLQYSGVNGLVHRSKWRSQHLLILCYHGVSMEDEEAWRPGLFVPLPIFRARMEALRRRRCTVLPFQEAMERLALDDLPPRAVTLTFDDGFHNYYALAAPVLAELGLPATLYLTTYYVDHQIPVWNLAVDYLLWKHCASGRRIGAELGLTEATVLDGPEAARRVSQRLARLAEPLSGALKDQLLARLAGTLGVDYAAFCRERRFHLMTPAEVRELAARPGFRFELHTHRHCAPRDERRFRREIRENRDRVAALTGTAPAHFCYPSGEYDPAFLPWLRDEGVQSATTCDPALAAPSGDLFRLPRLLDWSGLTPIEFDAWLCGSGHMVQRLAPSRAGAASPDLPS